MVLGTAAYMAPEQAKGKKVDRRADIWAFGVVLFEMLAGERAFKGEDVSDVLAAVLRQDIDWRALPPSTPTNVRRVLERCLERDPARRLRDIGDVWIGMDPPEEPAATPGATSPSRSASTVRTWLPWAVALVIAVGSVAWAFSRRADPAPPLVTRSAQTMKDLSVFVASRRARLIILFRHRVSWRTSRAPRATGPRSRGRTARGRTKCCRGNRDKIGEQAGSRQMVVSSRTESTTREMSQTSGRSRSSAER
jgi:serine/threonine protein kinase